MTIRLLLSLVLIAATLAGMASTAAAQEASAVPIFDTPGIWRIYHTLKPPMIQQPDGSLAPLLLNVRWLDGETPPAPADWARPEASDRSWMRGPARRAASTPYLANLHLRGKFEVTDPASVGELALALEYYGGAVVYLNGRELGRGHLPPGEIGDKTLAEPYPLTAFLDANGNLLDERGNPADKIRSRTLNLPVPRERLVKGVNVLAIQLVRAPYPAVLLEMHPRGVGGQSKDAALMWNTCEIRKASLTATAADGLVPNVTRPEGLQVWNGDPLAGDVDVDYGDRTEPLEPVRIVIPRNGRLSGKVIVGSDKPIRELKVEAGELKGPAGATIAAAQVSFLYGVSGGSEALHSGDTLPPYPDRAGFLNALVSEPLSEFPVVVRSSNRSRVNGAVVPVWVRVKVPRDAAPGDYRGTFTIRAAEAPAVTVPLQVTVLPYTLPDPQDFRTWVELIQSPDTLALEYKVPLWSDEHFELIARSFRLVSDTGARSLYIPAIAHTNLGNAESMIRWIRKADGSYDWDFSIMERYLDTAEKSLGKPKLIVLQVWEVYMNTPDSTGRRFGLVLEENQKNTGGAPLVTFIDAAGKVENGTIPKLSDPSSKAIWGELLKQVRQRLKRRGLEETIQLGMFTDSTPNKPDTQLFADIAPDLPWVQQGHNTFTQLHGIAKVGYTATWWSQRFADDLVNRRSGTTEGRTSADGKTVMTSLHGWNNPRLDVYYPRMTNENFPVSYWHFMCETAVTGDQFHGIGRVGADYWSVIRNRDGRRVGWVNERFEEVSGYLHKLHSHMLEPRPEGQVAMTRLVALEEGVQESEARILIEDALVNGKLAGRAPELARRCQEALDERLLTIWKGLGNMRFGGWGVSARRFQAGVSGHAWLLNSRYPELGEKLYRLAGEVQEATKSGK